MLSPFKIIFCSVSYLVSSDFLTSQECIGHFKSCYEQPRLSDLREVPAESSNFRTR